MPKRETIGSGITEYARVGVSLEELRADPSLPARVFGPQDDVWRWHSYVADVMAGPVAEYLAKAEASPGKTYREYQDPEWFAFMIWLRWHDVERRVKDNNANFAAMDAIELGMLVIQFLHKLDIEPLWEWGRDKRRASSDGGKSRAGKVKPATAERIMAVQNVLDRNPGLSIASAAFQAAKNLGTPEYEGAIRKAYERHARKLDES